MIIRKWNEKRAESLHLKKMHSSSSKMYQPHKTASERFSPYIKTLIELKEIKEYLRPSRMCGSEERGIKSEFMYSEVGIQIVLRKERSICFDNPTHRDCFRIHALHEYQSLYRLPYSGIRARELTSATLFTHTLGFSPANPPSSGDAD